MRETPRRALLVLAPLVAVGLLVLLGFELAASQRQARQEVQARFHDRAAISAQLIEALFEASLMNSQTVASMRLGDAHVSPGGLAAVSKSLQLGYARVLDARGRTLASTANAPPMDPGTQPVPGAPRGPFRLADLGAGPAGSAVQWAVPYRSRRGPRVLVEGLRASLIAGFLEAFLGRTPNPLAATFYVVDAHGVVLGVAHGAGRPGALIPEPALSGILSAHRPEGEYGDGLFFTTAPVENSSWRVVLRARRDRVLASVTGSRRTIPWAIFAAFGISVLLGLALLLRVMNASREIERRELSQRHAVEINDNIIQRLVLAKYALERGEHASSEEKLSETLSEAQRLVDDLLADRSVVPGSLRRRGPASISDR